MDREDSNFLIDSCKEVELDALAYRILEGHTFQEEDHTYKGEGDEDKE